MMVMQQPLLTKSGKWRRVFPIINFNVFFSAFSAELSSTELQRPFGALL